MSEKTKTPYSLWEYLDDIGRYIRPYAGQFGLGSFLRLSSDIANLYPAWALSQLVVLLSQNQSLNQAGPFILKLLAGWFAVVTYFAIAHAAAKWFGYGVGERISLDARYQALRHIFSLDSAWQEKENTGNKLKRINHGSQSLNNTVRIFFDVIIEASLNSAGMFFIFTSLSPELGIALLIFMVAYFVLSSSLTNKAAAQSYLVNTLEEDAEGLSFESLNNIKTVKSLSIQPTLLAKLHTQTEDLFGMIRKRITLFRVRSGILNLFYLLFEVSLISYIVFEIIKGRFSPAVLVLFVGYFGKVEEAIVELAEVGHDLIINKVQFHRLKEILDIQPTIEGEHAQPQFDMPTNWQKIEFKNVSFSYESKPILKNFNLTIQRGQKIGIVGLSGAGKSTLFSLLLDLYENYEGDILVDNLPLTQINRQNYINHLAVVLQETELFNETLKTNILIGAQPNKKVSPTQLKHAISTAYLDEVIDRLPQGMETVIGEKGVKLSGGEKQRLGIARALYRQPDLLLMDEATSHLDVESEKKIQASLHTFFNQVTAVVIAHRLSTIREMDEILVMQGGKIVERGSFSELIKKGTVFAKLWDKQKL